MDFGAFFPTLCLFAILITLLVLGVYFSKLASRNSRARPVKRLDSTPLPNATLDKTISQPSSAPSPAQPPVQTPVEKQKSDNARLYTQRQLTNAESRFYDFLKLIIKDRYLIETKTPLRNLFKRYGWLDRGLYTMHSKGHIDFVLLEPNLKNPILAIELDDTTHDSPKRQEQDRRKDELFSRANLKLLRFRTGKIWGAEEEKAIREALPRPIDS